MVKNNESACRRNGESVNRRMGEVIRFMASQNAIPSFEVDWYHEMRYLLQKAFRRSLRPKQGIFFNGQVFNAYKFITEQYTTSVHH
jgi:hypothetical protein